MTEPFVQMLSHLNISLKTYSIFPSHCTAVSDLYLQTSDFLRELDSLGVSERLPLILDVPDVQDLAHEVDGGLGLVEGSGGDIHVEHHLPLARSHRLMESKPDLASSTQRMIVAIGTGEE